MSTHAAGMADTIAAIATAPGESGIGIVRVSGREALAVGDEVVRLASGKKISACRSFTIHYGWIMDSGGAHRIDEVLVSVMKAPRSYTREHIIEINCHGGIGAMRAVLARVLDAGCRPAEPGEFTRRAFLNGRIDLAQAEGVLDIVRAKTDAARSLGISQLSGALSNKVNESRQAVISVLSSLEAELDFPDEDIPPPERQALLQSLAKVAETVSAMLARADGGRIIREGLDAVLCGRPNAGKSSLLNALLRQERSIVTPVPGTTRDSIEELVDIRGVPVRIIDTAGVISPQDRIERKAVERTREWVKRAQLIILVFDGSKPAGEEDRKVMGMVRRSRKKVIPVVNKTDLRQRFDRKKILSMFGKPVEVSCRTRSNIAGLEEAVADHAARDFCCPESWLLSNARHIRCARQALSALRGAQTAISANSGSELTCQHLREACSRLDEITGGNFSDSLLDTIFGEFCIGK